MGAAGQEVVNDIARPIHNKCEKVRLRVRDNYNNSLARKVCVKYVLNVQVESD